MFFNDLISAFDLSYLYLKWPWALGLLLLWIFIPVLYQKAQQHRWKNSLRFSYTSASEHLLRNASPFKRLVLPLITFYILFLLILAFSRPTAVIQVPVESVDMMMVVDVSLSMKAKDIVPSRLEAAKRAGERFIQSLPKDVRIGLIYFAGTSAIQSLPTRDHRQIETLLHSLKKDDLRSGTALGEGIKDALKAMALRRKKDLENDKAESSQGKTADEKSPSPQRVIVLISDGDQNTGYPWTVASSKALEENVVIHTVAIGSREVSEIEYEGQLYPVYLDDNTLKQIARITEGHFYRAFNESDFKAIYQHVRKRSIVFEESHEDIGFLFVGFALMLFLLQQILAVFWLKRFP